MEIGTGRLQGKRPPLRPRDPGGNDGKKKASTTVPVETMEEEPII